MLLSLLVLSALAGDLVVVAEVPAELRESGALLVQTWTPGSLRLTGLRPGPHLLEVVAAGKARTLTVQVPEQGEARLELGATKLSVVERPPAPPVRPALELRADSDDPFALVLGGERTCVFTRGATVVLEGLAEGEHALEIRSADLLTIWSRGTLVLGPDTRVVATAARGRALDVFGPEGAWAAAVAQPAPPAGP